MKRATRLQLATCAGAVLFPALAAAQSVTELLPPSADPLAQRIGQLAAPAPSAAPSPAEVDGGATFALREIVLEGATAFEPEDLRPIWQPLLGSSVTLVQLKAVAAAIGARYRDAGYVLSQAFVPAQTVTDGRVRIQIVEGFVDRVAVDGGPPAALAATERRFARMAEARPLALAELERAVLLSRDTLGGEVETVVAPSPDTFGAADMTVILKPDPVTGFIALDTRGSRLYGDVTASAGATAFGLLGLRERLDILASGDPLGGDFGYLRGDAALPLNIAEGTALDGAVLGLRAEASTGEPDTDLDGLRLLSEEFSLGASLTVPFTRSRTENFFGRVGLEWRQSDSLTSFAGADDEVREELVVLEAGLSWDRADRLGGVTLVDVSLRQGLDFGPAEIEATGPAAPDADFTRLLGRLARLQRLGESWSAFGEAIWQWSWASLPGGERFSLGGSTVGRGFAPGNTTGDSGFGLRLEVRHQVDGFGRDRAAELYAFVDYGRARDDSAARDGDRWEGLSSVGLGARIDLAEWLTLTPEIVRQTSGGPADRDGSALETRAFLGVVARF